jgi:hypothetical protein
MSLNVHTPSRKSLAGAAVMAVALILVALGANALWLDGDRGHDWYVSLGPQHVETAGRTVTTPSLVTGDYVPHWLVSSERVTVSTINSAQPVSVRVVRSGETRTVALAEAHGGGPVALTWKPAPGHWNVAVMNVDGSRGVDAQVTLAAKVPPLLAPGLILVAIGIAGGLGGFALVRRRPPALG